MISIEATALAGVYILRLPTQSDRRGSFVKTVHAADFRRHGLRSDFNEQFFTISKRNVLRGMHCQLPPHEHAKLVTCLFGEILDVVVDLRKAQPSYKRCVAYTLKPELGRAIYIPPGCAHGFLSISDQAVTGYNVTSVHSPPHDTGVLWRSIDFDWPVGTPILSERDQNLPQCSDFDSPF